MVHPRKYDIAGLVSCAQPFMCSKSKYASLWSVYLPHNFSLYHWRYYPLYWVHCIIPRIYISTHITSDPNTFGNFYIWKPYSSQTYFTQFMFNTWIVCFRQKMMTRAHEKQRCTRPRCTSLCLCSVFFRQKTGMREHERQYSVPKLVYTCHQGREEQLQLII